MKKFSVFAALAAMLLALVSVPMWSQSNQVEGTVTDGGKPVPNAQLTLTNVGTSKTFKVKTDKNGKFAMLGVPPGQYDIDVASSTGEKLYQQRSSISPNETGVAVVKIEIGQSNAGASQGQSGQISEGGGKSGQQQPKYTKEQIEEIKKQNEKATGTNTLIQQALNSMNAKNWQEAMPVLQQLITADPNNWQYYSAMGDCLLNTNEYDKAVENYQKGIQIAESNTAVDPKNPSTDPARKKSGIAKMLTNEGNALLKLHKNAEAVDAYTKAASMDPNPAVAYFNLCATQYNTGNVDGALAACDKAIAADPNRADAYFIKGSLLIAGSKTDKEGKVEAPPGTADALNKYLQLQPDGPHANDVKQMLAYIGSKIETTYKERKKK